MQCGAICYPLWLCLAGVSVERFHCVGCGSVFCSFLTSNRKLRHVNNEICNYWCSECTVLRFIHMESTNMLCQGKNYHMKHSSVLVDSLVHDHVLPPFNRQCSLGLRGFQIGL